MTDFTKGFGFREAIDYAASRGVRLPDEYYGKLVGVQRAQSVSIAGLASLEQIKYVIDQVQKTLDKGGTFADFQKAVAANQLGIDLPKHRLDNIFRTNIQAAYARGRWNQQSRVRSTRPYLMYDAVNDSRTRPGHLSMDGVVLKWDSPFWATHYPPNGYRCRCTVISLSQKQAEKRGITPEGSEDTEKPDEGWDYNPGVDYKAGTDRATTKTVTKIKTKAPKASAAVDKAAKTIAAKAAKAQPTLASVTELGRQALAALPEYTGARSARVWNDAFDNLITERVLKRPDLMKTATNSTITYRNRASAARARAERFVELKTVTNVLDDNMAQRQRAAMWSTLVLPERWLKNTNSYYPAGIKIQYSNDRAWANQSSGILSVTDGSPDVMLHEFMHLVQVANPELQQMAREHHKARTLNQPLRKMKDVTGNPAYDDSEVTREDQYFSPYAGKEYSTYNNGQRMKDDPLELLTVGFQALMGDMYGEVNAAGGNPMRHSLLMRDEATAEFILGLLLSYD